MEDSHDSMRVTRIAGSECLEIAPAFSVKPEGAGRMSEGSFRGDRFFLSNFYEAALEFGGITYGSSVAAYQAQKCSSEEDQRLFSRLSPAEAKELGGQLEPRPGWD
jgi:hypothetical protein